jgi:hypothetical protein
LSLICAMQSEMERRLGFEDDMMTHLWSWDWTRIHNKEESMGASTWLKLHWSTALSTHRCASNFLTMGPNLKANIQYHWEILTG